ncbi:cation:proton antiporter domain-containing protein [Roseimarinus sediminis]|uniref:cation:proton antiporter domain-containing protein n=1 Tax=Roseimarinus sediminis TaxID=1610899 RepID=UPI003D24D329
MDTYSLIIAASIVIVLSSLFNILAKRTSFPSVLLLIGLGIAIRAVLESSEIDVNLFPVLEVLGVIGLIMIVLEAALDLELRKEKRTLIIKSMIIALLGLVISSIIITYLFRFFIPNIDFLTGFIYAIPLSIMSSAIIIPSVVNLSEDKREFMVYESTFSDIFGIMLFYYVLGNVNSNGLQEIAINVSTSLLTTIVVSLVLGYLLVMALQALRGGVKFFLILAILILLYSVGKMMHISSLLIILIFGLILNNRTVFFRGRLSKLTTRRGVARLMDDFKLFTAETSFFVRTFFFVFFGMSMSVESLGGGKVWMLSLLVLLILFIVRFVLFATINPKKKYPSVWIAPRGLISILLFFAIPEEFVISDFESGVLFVVILGTALIMAVSLMIERKGKREDHEDVNLPLEQ